MDTLTRIRDSFPPPIAVALVMCWGVWFLTELLTEWPLSRWRDRSWCRALVRMLPLLIGAFLCELPLLDFTREEILGYSPLVIASDRRFSYGIACGAFAMVAHAWGLRPLLEGTVRKMLRIPVAVKPGESAEPAADPIERAEHVADGLPQPPPRGKRR